MRTLFKLCLILGAAALTWSLAYAIFSTFESIMRNFAHVATY